MKYQRCFGKRKRLIIEYCKVCFKLKVTNISVIVQILEENRSEAKSFGWKW